MSELRLEYVPLSTLTRFAENPKLHDIQSLVESFEKYGFLDPPKWDKSLNDGAGGLVEGNGREEALEWMKHQGRQPPRGVVPTEDGDWAVPVLFGNDVADEATAQLYAIDHNNLVMAGADYTVFDTARLWDENQYKEMLGRLGQEGQFPVSVDGDGLDLLLEVGKNGDGGKDKGLQITQTEAEKYQEIWQVRLGDVWELGRHKISCSDSLDKSNVLSIVGDAMINFVWADPPYGINIVAANVSVGGGEAYDIPFEGVKKGYVGGGARIKASPGLYPIETWKKNRGAKPFGSKKVRGSDGTANIVDVGKYAPVVGDDTIQTAINGVLLCLELWPDACQVWWGGNYYASVLPNSPGWIVWDKDNTGNFADCELAWTNQNKAARIFEHRWNGMLKASEQGQRRVHPTQKPIALAEKVFREYGTQPGIIFDPFLGSGISILGAENLGDEYKVIGCELVPEYIAVTIQRWVDLTGLEPKRKE